MNSVLSGRVFSGRVFSGGALRAEWTKARTLASTGWLLAAIVALTVAVSAGVAASARCPVAGCAQDPAKASLAGVNLGQAVVAILAVLAISNEYSTGMIKLTLAALPHRGSVLAAKAVTLTASVLVAGAISMLASLLAGRLILPGHGFTGFSLSDAALLRATAGSVLYLVLIGLLSLGIAAIARDAATSIGLVLGLLYVFPIVAQALSDDPAWHRHLEQIGPMTAGLAIQDTVDLAAQPIGPWAGLGVLALWAAGALLLGGVLLVRRDA